MTTDTAVRRFLDLSTSHLTLSTRKLLDDGCGPSSIYRHPDDYGWFIYVYDDFDMNDPAEEVVLDATGEPIPADLLVCLKKARELGCDYILFDCDGPVHGELASYDDDGEVDEDDQVEYAEHSLWS